MSKMINCSTKDRIKAIAVDYAVSFLICITTVMIMATMVYIAYIAFQIDLRNIRGDVLAYIIAFKIFPIFKELFFPCGSIGYKLLKFKVVDLENDQKPTNKKMLIRGLIFAIFPMIDIIVSAVRLDRRTLTDIITKTRVIYIPKEKEDDFS